MHAGERHLTNTFYIWYVYIYINSDDKNDAGERHNTNMF